MVQYDFIHTLFSHKEDKIEYFFKFDWNKQKEDNELQQGICSDCRNKKDKFFLSKMNGKLLCIPCYSEILNQVALAEQIFPKQKFRWN